MVVVGDGGGWWRPEFQQIYVVGNEIYQQVRVLVLVLVDGWL